MALSDKRQAFLLYRGRFNTFGQTAGQTDCSCLTGPRTDVLLVELKQPQTKVSFAQATTCLQNSAPINCLVRLSVFLLFYYVAVCLGSYQYVKEMSLRWLCSMSRWQNDSILTLNMGPLYFNPSSVCSSWIIHHTGCTCIRTIDTSSVDLPPVALHIMC